MDAKTYLQQIGLNLEIIKDKKNEIVQLYTLATSITAPMGTEPVQTSNISDKVGKFGAEVADLRAKIEAEILDLQKDNMNRIETIRQVRNIVQYKILYKHYVEGKKFKKIAEEVHYSEVTISNKHTEALERVQEILDRKKRQGK